MKIVNVIKNYLPLTECDTLNAWVRDAIANDLIGKGVTAGGVESPLRYTSRFSSSKFEYPQIVRDIRARIEGEFNLTQWKDPIHPHAKDGVVVSATMPDGDVYSHTDPKQSNSFDGSIPKETLRCNILTSETQGGLIWVEGQSYLLQKGDMIQYLVSRHEHHVDKVIGMQGDLRIMWMFGWYVDGDVWEKNIN